MRKALRATALVMGLFAGAALAQAQNSSDLFPRPAALEPAVQFWTRVYTEVGTDGGFVHDSVHLDVVYETVRFGANPSARERRRVTTNATDKYRAILRKLATGERGALSTDEARVLALWPAGTPDAEFGRAADRLRFQLGQANRFREGLIRAGRYREHILEILAAKGLPAELAALPHVESSFDPTAYSKVGAAGLWQFTRSTGLRYMQIDHIVDERRDPFLSTSAAAQLLADNYAVIQSWPLAITAYNHGLAGMRRAAGQLGTKDIDVIVANYSSRSFGFASRNFYTAFLAALEVDNNVERYFGKLTVESPEAHLIVDLSDYMDAAPVARALGISRSELQRLNPALMETVWQGDKFIPRGFSLRLPGSVVDPLALLAGMPSAERFAQQRADQYHRVRGGETLSEIAESYSVSLAALVRANNLSSRNFIRTGQLLTLPIAGEGIPAGRAPGGQSAPESGQYVVRRGDSIDRIARRFGVDEATLLSVNGISDRNRIYVGQVLSLSLDDAPAAAEVSVATLVAANVEPEADLVDDVTEALANGDEVLADPADVLRDDRAGFVAAAVEAAAQDVLPTGSAAIVARVAAAQESSARPDADPVVAALDPAAPAIDPADLEPADLAPEVVVDENEVPDLDSNVLASTQATLAADPSDYSVAEDSSIEVQAEETLGHYADWLGIRTQRLRDLNGMPFEQPVVIGERIRLDFSQVTSADFEQRRLAYQEQRQEAFFRAFQIADITNHVVARGESLWLLALRTYDVPVWLLRQYNPDLDLDRVRPGAVVKFPVLVPVAGQADSTLDVATLEAPGTGRAADERG